MYNDDFSYYRDKLTTMSNYILDSAGWMDRLATYENITKSDRDSLEDIVQDIVDDVSRLENEIKLIRKLTLRRSSKWKTISNTLRVDYKVCQ